MAMQPGNWALPQAEDDAQAHDDPANCIRSGRFFALVHVIGPDAAFAEHDQRLFILFFFVVVIFIIEVVIIPVQTTHVHTIIGTDSHFLGKLRQFKIPLE